jgi:hypothetical protein
MAKYVRTANTCNAFAGTEGTKDCGTVKRDKLLFTVCFSRKYVAQKLDTECPLLVGPSNLAFETCWPNTHGLQALTLSFPAGYKET